MPKTQEARFKRRLTIVAVAIGLLATPLTSQQFRLRLGRAVAYQPDCSGTGTPCEAWSHFRTAHPFPYQSIQWTELPDNRLAVMLLEPPPVMPKAELERLIRSAFGTDLRSFNRLRWRMGADGWLEDVVFTVTKPAAMKGPASDPLRDPLLRDRVAFLYFALFGTSYGGTFDRIDAVTSSSASGAPNLRINPAEIRRWMDEPTLRWTPVDGGSDTGTAWQTLATQKKTGAYLAADRSLYLLTFPVDLIRKSQRGVDELDSLRAPFRRFAVATDSIAGTFQAPSGQVAILGRPRTQAMADVPPLRFETFRLLASQTGDELSQSYERSSLFAGKLDRGEFRDWDWAPVYLSDALIDTEFGELLNTTDQLLKSWSEAGNVEYLYFTYGKPTEFPFQKPLRIANGSPAAGRSGPMPLSDKVRQATGSNEVLYNWNTAGSAVLVNASFGKALTARQTGALPVTYGADARGTKNLVTGGGLLGDEETAYKYFAGRRDANLERVVQYTLLYQFFRALDDGAGIKGSGSPREQEQAIKARHAAAAIRVEATIRLLRDLRAGRLEISPKDKAELNSKLQRFRAQNPGLADDVSLANLVADRFSDVAVKFDAARKARLEAMEADIDKEIRSYNLAVDQHNSGTSPDPVAVFLQSRTFQTLPARKAEIDKKQADFDRALKDNPLDDIRIILADIASDGADMEDIRQGFITSFNYEPSGSIKTPSIVVSWNAADLEEVGGHNLDARTLKLEPSAKATRISLEQTENGPVLRYPLSEASLVESHATDLARAVEHGHVESSVELQKIVTVPVPVRLRTAALELPRPAAGGGIQSISEPVFGRIGSRPFTSKSEFVDTLGAIAEKNDCCIFIAHDADEVAYATERNLKPPPASLRTEIRDTPSLTAYLEAAARNKRSVVFLDTPEEHVEALSIAATSGQRNTASLNDMATALGKRRAGNAGARVSGVAEPDLNGNMSFLKTPGDQPGGAPKDLFSRLVQGESPTAWIQAEVKRLDPGEAENLVSAIGWNRASDGSPTAIVVKFGGGNANVPPIDVSVVAGFADGDLQAGQRALFAAHDKNFAAAQAKRASLAQYAVTLRNELRQMGQIRLKRLMVVVTQGKTKTLLSLREDGGFTVRHDTQHAG